MPVHVFRFPDVIEPRGEILVEPGETEFFPFAFRNSDWLVGVHCLSDDSGGIVRDVMNIPILSLSGHEHAANITLFNHTIEESILKPRQAFRFERALKGASVIVRLCVAHIPRGQAVLQPLQLAA